MILVSVIGGFAVFVGAVLQRLSGVGAGLIVAPVMAWLVGPVVGVVVTNITTIVSALMIFVVVRRDVEWRRFRCLLFGVFFGAFPGAVVVMLLGSSWLQVFIGTLVLAGLWVTLRNRAYRLSDSSGASMLFGAAGSFLNTAAGVAAPVMVIYGEGIKWQRASFLATLQPTFFSMSVLSLTAKLSLGLSPGWFIRLWWLVPVSSLLVGAGLWAGSRLHPRVTDVAGRRLAVFCAAAGGMLVLASGLLELTGRMT